MRRAPAVCAFLFVGVALFAAHGQSVSSLKLTQTISLGGVEGRIDHFAFDTTRRRLFICALGNNSVEVVDLAKGERIHSITGLGSPQGVAYAPDPDRLFVANDRGGVCKIFDGKSFQQLGEIDLKDDADNVRYDAATKKVYVGFGSGGIATINAADGKQVGSIKLNAHPEAFELEKSGGRIYANLPNSRQVAVIDRNQGKVIAAWGTDWAFANFPMALDENNHRLLVGCRKPSKLLVIDTDSGRVISKIDIAGDCDDIYYDTKRRRLYVICGAGKIDIIEQADPNTYKTSASIDTAKGARTGLFVPQWDTLFIAVPHNEPQRAEIRAYHAE